MDSYYLNDAVYLVLRIAGRSGLVVHGESFGTTEFPLLKEEAS
jgi:hypothetical protein